MKKVGNQFSHEKRFGQYFSGDKVATLLSLLLPQGLQYSSIIDPMAGSGDLLNAVISKATPNARVLGIEIDEPIATMCQKDYLKRPSSVKMPFKVKLLLQKKGGIWLLQILRMYAISFRMTIIA